MDIGRPGGRRHHVRKSNILPQRSDCTIFELAAEWNEHRLALTDINNALPIGPSSMTLSQTLIDKQINPPSRQATCNNKTDQREAE